MPAIRQIWPDLLPTAEGVKQLISALRSDQPPRPVVTPTGHRARGHFPSYKGKKTRYESLVEEDALRVLEVATSVLTIETHPFVLDLNDARGKHFTYTPDAFITRADTALLVEVKGDWLLRLQEPAMAMLRNFKALEQRGVPIALLTEADVRPGSLQEELKELIRLRPIGGRNRRVDDPTQWDVVGNAQPSGDLLRRWWDAQRECNELLERVMRRGPDEVVNVVTE